MTDTHGTYKSKNTGSPPKLRPGTLLRYSDPGYTPPEKKEFAAVIQYADISSAVAGAILGIDARTNRRYKSGERGIPYAVWRLLLLEVGIISPEKLEFITKCNDCERDLSEREKSITQCDSPRHGTYYDGPPICDRCAEKRYEQALMDKEDSTSKGN